MMSDLALGFALTGLAWLGLLAAVIHGRTSIRRRAVRHTRRTDPGRRE
ncbi:hypothetical protein ACNS7O_17695 (plasmid) [Haloferacaceae archaeon DSL9]